MSVETNEMRRRGGRDAPWCSHRASPVKCEISPATRAYFCMRRNVRPPKLRSPSRKAKKSRPFRGPVLCPNTVPSPQSSLHNNAASWRVLDLTGSSLHRGSKLCSTVSVCLCSMIRPGVLCTYPAASVKVMPTNARFFTLSLRSSTSVLTFFAFGRRASAVEPSAPSSSMSAS